MSRRGIGVLLGGVLLAAACSSTGVELGDGEVLLTIEAESTDDFITEVSPVSDHSVAIIEDTEVEAFWERAYLNEELRDRLVERTMANIDSPGSHGGVSRATLEAVGARLVVTDGSGEAAIGVMPGGYLVCLLFESLPGATAAEFQIWSCAWVGIVGDTILRMHDTGEGGVFADVIEPGS